MTLEIRAFPDATIQDVRPERREVVARCLTYNSSDSYGSVWLPGCASDSMRADKKPVVVAHHDLTRPIGKIVDYEDGDKALDITVRFADQDAVPDARAAFSLISEGICDGWSIGFSRTRWDAVPKEQRSDFGTNEAKEFMRAVNLREVSLVALPAVNGTGVLAIRSDEPDTTLHPPTIAEIEHLFQANLLDREEARALLADLPEYRMRIVLGGTTAPPVVEIATEAPTAPAVVAVEPAEARAGAAMPMVPVAQSGDGDGDADADDVATLAASTDAALDSAVYWLSKSSPEDLAAMPDNIQQAVALVQAASVVVDDLLDALGIADPDDPDEMEGSGDDSGRAAETPEVAEEAEGAPPEAREDPEAEVEGRALSDKKWDPKPADYTLAQWKAACLIWSGPSDEVGSGSLPVLEPNGDPNRAGMAAAAARLNQVDAPDAAKQAAAKKLLGLYGSNKLKAPGSLLQAARSVEDPEVRALVADAVDGELDALFGRLGVEAA